ncbi:MAG: hypothetical protein AAGF91_11355, partial [Actinomycetota bacterium]
MATATVALSLAASTAMLGGPSAAADGTSTTSCTRIFQQFSYDGGDLDAATVSVPAIDGFVISVSVELADFAHPETESELGERVVVIAGGEVLGTTPDLPDDVVRTTLGFAVGRPLAFDEVTVRHAPLAVPDDVFVKKVCFEVGDTPSPTTTTTTTTSTTTTTTTTTVAPIESTTTTVAPIESTTTTVAPAES